MSRHILTTLAQRYLDQHARAPRGLGFSVDEGLPDRGRRYGGAQTIHNTGTVDIVMHDGHVTEVWFRCQLLAFNVSDPKGHTVYEGGGARLIAVEVAP